MPQISVGFGVKNPSHDVSLVDEAGEKWGLKLEGGVRGIQEASQTASTILQRGGAQKWGDYDPTFGHIQQDTWHGGLGQEEFSDDPTRFYHSQNAWTMTPGRLHSTLRWQFADCDNRKYNQIAFADMEWHALLGSELYIASKFTTPAEYAADKAYVWLRRVGTPGTLTLKIYTDTGGKPNAVQGSASKTVSVSDVTDTVAVWKVFDWTGTETLSNSTAYHVVVYGAAADNANNHWEVGVNEAGSASHYDDNGAGWTAASYTMYYRVVDADTACRWHYFMLDSDETYQVSEPATGTSLLEVWDETNDEWDAVTMASGALSNIVKSVAVGNGLAHMARGTTEEIGIFHKDGADYKFDDDAAAKADHLHVFYDPVDGAQLWRAENDSVDISRSDVKAFETDLAFGTEITVGDSTAEIIGLKDYNDQLWVRKEDSVWSVKNDRASRLAAGLNAVFETSTYGPMLAKNLSLYIGWDHSVERLTGGTLDDIGPWRGAGLPKDYQGRVADMCSGIGMTFWAIDGGSSNYSSVLVDDGTGLHTIFAGPEKGQRIRSVFWQPVASAPGRLWISYGADSIYMVFPEHTLNPLHDTAVNFHHEFVLETSTFTMGAEQLPKLFKELDFITEGLGSNGNIAVDYKLDADIGDSTKKWNEVTTIYHSPYDVIPLSKGNKRRIRFRIRGRTEDADKPAVVIAYILDCLARTPMKRQWNLRVKIGHLQRTKTGAQDHDPVDFYNWLVDAAMSAREIHMRANSAIMDDINVIVQPAALFRTFINTIQGWEAGVVTLTLLEA